MNRPKNNLGIDSIDECLILGCIMILAGSIAPAIGQSMVKNGWWAYSTFSASVLVFTIVGMVAGFIAVFLLRRN